MIEFLSSNDFEPGIISTILRKSYARLSEHKDIDWGKFTAGFDVFDAEVFANQFIADCTFISVLNGNPVGIGSFDPRQKPAYGVIGHNCVLPEAQGQGVGRAQIMRILDEFKKREIHTARVSTGVDPFFASAQRMYESCGFLKTRTFKSDLYPHWKMVEYELTL